MKSKHGPSERQICQQNCTLSNLLDLSELACPVSKVDWSAKVDKVALSRGFEACQQGSLVRGQSCSELRNIEVLSPVSKADWSAKVGKVALS